MNKKILLLCIVVVFLYGCASEKSSIPETDSAQLPPPEIQKVEPVNPEETAKEISTINEAPTPEAASDISDQEDKPPVLKNLGINIKPWNKETNRAGDLIFTKKLIFEDDNVMNEWVFVEFGVQGQRKNDPSKNIEYWFHVPLGTKLHAPIDGIIHVGFISHTKDWGINIAPSTNSNWFVSFEHMTNLTVKEGDIVKAGDIVGEAAPRSSFNYEIAMVELAVWRGGNEVFKYCPFLFLEDSLKPEYKKKLNQLAQDWEDFIGEDVYQQKKWVAPGCLLHNITER